MSLLWWSPASVVPLPFQTRLITRYRHKQHHSHLRLRKLGVHPFKFTGARAILLDEIAQLTHNKVLVAAGVSAAIGQLAKPFTSVIIYGKEFNFRTAFEAGGFPSTHSSAVVAAATILGIERGLADSVFGLTVIYASLIMYDAQGVRREVGNHAKAINKLLQSKTQVNSSFPSKDQDRQVDSQPEKGISPVNRNFESSLPLVSEDGMKTLSALNPVKEDIASSGLAADTEEGSRLGASSWKPFKESIGHTEVEVVAGALLGFTVSLITNILI